MKWFDIVLTKTAVLFFTLFLVDIFPQLLGWNWRVYFWLSFAAVLPIMLRIFEKIWLRLIYVSSYSVTYLIAEYYF